jgi:predicted nucleic acid-binding protein
VSQELGWLDANLFIVPLFENDPARPRCLAILRALRDGAATGWIDVIVVHELTYALRRTGFREFQSRHGILAYIRDFLALDTIWAEDKVGLLEALGRWAEQGVGFADARLAVLAQQRDLPVCSVNVADFPSDTENTYLTIDL